MEEIIYVIGPTTLMSKKFCKHFHTGHKCTAVYMLQLNILHKVLNINIVHVFYQFRSNGGMASEKTKLHKIHSISDTEPEDMDTGNAKGRKSPRKRVRKQEKTTDNSDTEVNNIFDVAADAYVMSYIIWSFRKKRILSATSICDTSCFWMTNLKFIIMQYLKISRHTYKIAIWFIMSNFSCWIISDHTAWVFCSLKMTYHRRRGRLIMHIWQVQQDKLSVSTGKNVTVETPTITKNTFTQLALWPNLVGKQEVSQK